MNHIRYGLVARICRSHQRVAGKARVQFPVSEIIFFALFSPFFRPFFAFADVLGWMWATWVILGRSETAPGRRLLLLLALWSSTVCM